MLIYAWLWRPLGASGSCWRLRCNPNSRPKARSGSVGSQPGTLSSVTPPNIFAALLAKSFAHCQTAGSADVEAAFFVAADPKPTRKKRRCRPRGLCLSTEASGVKTVDTRRTANVRVGSKAAFDLRSATSVLPRSTDIFRAGRHVSNVPNSGRRLTTYSAACPCQRRFASFQQTRRRTWPAPTNAQSCAIRLRSRPARNRTGSVRR
jgi:hypothetical protein